MTIQCLVFSYPLLPAWGHSKWSAKTVLYVLLVLGWWKRCILLKVQSFRVSMHLHMVLLVTILLYCYSGLWIPYFSLTLLPIWRWCCRLSLDRSRRSHILAQSRDIAQALTFHNTRLILGVTVVAGWCMLIHGEVYINIPIDCSLLRMCPLFIICSWSHRSIILCQTEDSNIFQAQTIQTDCKRSIYVTCCYSFTLHPLQINFENKPPFFLFC